MVILIVLFKVEIFVCDTLDISPSGTGVRAIDAGFCECTVRLMLAHEPLRACPTQQNQSYFGKSNYFGYGLGMMNFTSMDWGFADEGLYYGHNGLTYGFGSQQGYNYPLEFAATWVNNWEKWIGPDNRGVPNELYTELCRIVRRHRQQYA